MESNQCIFCIFYLGNLRCAAFKEKIPNDILIGSFEHTKKHPEQENDIVFEEKE